MTRGKKIQTPTLEVHLLREGIVESSHQVEAAVCDRRGRVLLMAGNAENSAFIRSALKPFQALAITSTGTLQKYDLSDRDLAIACSSHALDNKASEVSHLEPGPTDNGLFPRTDITRGEPKPKTKRTVQSPTLKLHKNLE